MSKDYSMRFTTELKCHLAGFGNEEAEVIHAKLLNYLDKHFKTNRCNQISRYAFHTFCFTIKGDPVRIVKKIVQCKILANIDFELSMVKEVHTEPAYSI